VQWKGKGGDVVLGVFFVLVALEKLWGWGLTPCLGRCAGAGGGARPDLLL
jgi:hypothetical protein